MLSKSTKMESHPAPDGATLVSVIIPAFMAMPTIARAVRSLLGQSLADWQAIIISDDRVDYAAVLAAAGIRDGRLAFAMTGQIGGGAALARNIGLEMAVGRLVTPLDADDCFEPERLAILAPIALEAGAAFDNVRVVDDGTGRQINVLFEQPRDFLLTARMFFETSVPLMVVARRTLIDGWDPALSHCDDIGFNLRLFDMVPAIPVSARPLHDYRVREGSLCHDEHSTERMDKSYTTLLARLGEDGYGLRDVDLVAQAKQGVTVKRGLNQAFAAAHAAGVKDFQRFIAARPPSRCK
jgi:glycosyltransferase involved in cell wall biosynthesis